jgi:uncharacterized membrane protein YqgA involved in biofilm formation
MRLIKKTVITVLGVIIVLIGLVFIVLPGPAVLIIPLGLALLATEYPLAEKWLKKFQQMLSRSARRADNLWRRFKYRR